MVDESGSINNANFEKVTSFVADVIMKLDIETGRVRHPVLFNKTNGFRKEKINIFFSNVSCRNYRICRLKEQ